MYAGGGPGQNAENSIGASFANWNFAFDCLFASAAGSIFNQKI